MTQVTGTGNGVNQARGECSVCPTIFGVAFSLHIPLAARLFLVFLLKRTSIVLGYVLFAFLLIEKIKVGPAHCKVLAQVPFSITKLSRPGLSKPAFTQK